MTYSVNYGSQQQYTLTFGSFREALRVYRFKRAYQLTLPKRSWFSASVHNDALLDVDTDGLTEDEACDVCDDTVPRGLLNESKSRAYHGLVCGHAVAPAEVGDDGITRRKCLVCGHAFMEIS